MKFRSLRLFADENISPKVTVFLRQKGLDVGDLKERGWHGKKDRDILEEVFLEERFVLTHDSDFGKLVINEGKQCYGIVYLRIRNLQAQNVINVLEQLLSLDIDRTYAAHSRGRRKYVPVGLTAAIQAADTSFMSSASPAGV